MEIDGRLIQIDERSERVQSESWDESDGPSSVDGFQSFS